MKCEEKKEENSRKIRVTLPRSPSVLIFWQKSERWGVTNIKLILTIISDTTIVRDYSKDEVNCRLSDHGSIHP